MKILVTGATGQLGAKVVNALLAAVPAEELAVSVRNPEKAAALRDRGVDVRHGDFDDAASLDTAFAGIDRILIISTDGDNETRTRQHLAAVAAAKRAGVGFIAYTSLANLERSTLWLADVHRATEAAIRETGIPYALLRNNWYVENEMGVIQAAQAGAPVTTSAEGGRIGFAPRDDYAAAAAAVLTGSTDESRTYELSGPLATYDDFAAALSPALGREVPVQHVDDETYKQGLAGAGFPGFVVEIFGNIQRAIREGSLEIESDDLATLIGRPATPLKDALAAIVQGTTAS